MVSVDSFHQAKNYYGGRKKAVRLIVLHDMETDEQLSDAEAVGNYFAGPGAPKASAHVGVDADSTVGYVWIGDTAFGAAGANSDGFHIEQAGRARQSRDEWLDPFSRQTIRRAAKAGFEASNELSIPRRQLTVAEVADGVTSGFTDHATVSKAFPKVSTGHTDPGAFYPWDVFLADMAALGGGSGPQSPTQEDDVRFTYVQRQHGSGAVLALFDNGRTTSIHLPELGFATFEDIYVKTLGCELRVDPFPPGYHETKSIDDGSGEHRLVTIIGPGTADALGLP